MTYPFAHRERSLAVLVLVALVAGMLSLLVVAPPAKASHDGVLEVYREIITAGTGTSATITARLEDGSGGPGGGTAPIVIAFEFNGGPFDLDGGLHPETPDRKCTITTIPTPPAYPECSIGVTSANPGTGLVHAWVDEDKLDETPVTGVTELDRGEGRLSDQTTDCRTEAPGGPGPDPEFDSPIIVDPRVLQACEDGEEEPGADEQDDTDVVELAFARPGAAPRLDCAESTAAPVGGTARVRCIVSDSDGVRRPGMAVDGEHFGGANDPNNNEQNPADFNNACADSEAGTSGAGGICDVEVPGDENQTGPGTICAWVDSDSGDDNNLPSGNPSWGTGAGDGGECSEAENAAENANQTDKFIVRWEVARPVLNLDPETASSVTGSTHTITAAITDQFGTARDAGTDVFFEILSGSPSDKDGNTPATPDGSCKTSSNETGSKCTFSISSANVGTDTVCGWFGTAPSPISSPSCGGENPNENSGGSPKDAIDVVQKAWTAPPSTGGGQTDPTANQGYALVGTDGGIFNFGTAEFHGSTGDIKLNKPVVGMAYLPGGDGYWMVASDGGIFTFGKAAFHGSMADSPLNAPIIGMEATPDGKGYWLFASDGGIFSFGNAEFFGSMGDQKLNQPVVNMAANPSGKGYWLVALDGGTFSFGAAPFHGSMGDQRLNQPIFDLAPTGDAGGYWLVARDGGIFSFGNAANQFFGSAVGLTTNQVIGMGPTPTYKGYWITDNKGAVFPFGDAKFLGDMRNTALNGPIIAFTTIRKK